MSAWQEVRELWEENAVHTHIYSHRDGGILWPIFFVFSRKLKSSLIIGVEYHFHWMAIKRCIAYMWVFLFRNVYSIYSLLSMLLRSVPLSSIGRLPLICTCTVLLTMNSRTVVWECRHLASAFMNLTTLNTIKWPLWMGASNSKSIHVNTNCNCLVGL